MIYRFILPIIYLVLWQLTSIFLHIKYIPSLTAIFDAAVLGIMSGELYHDMMSTLIRLGLGFSIGALAALVIGAAIGMNRMIQRLTLSTINGIVSLPITAIFPLIIMTFGMTEAASLFIISLTAALPILLATIDGVADAVKKYDALIKNFELGFKTTLIKVLIPAAAPMILSSIGLSIGTAFKILVLAELMGVQSGIGFRIIETSQYINYAKIYYLIAVIIFMGVIFSSTAAYIRKRLLVWM
jgi:ABC-type nitrate/sulfonate/bicarbonate transport system permease component